VLDFIGNYKKAHYKVALITGRLENDNDPAAIKKLLQEFASGELALPPGVAIHFDLQAINLMRALIGKGEPRRQFLAEAFNEVESILGHAPSMLELHRHGRYDVRAYRQEFGSWFKFLLSQERLGAVDQALEAEAGPFLLELEKTAMTKSYKMVVLWVFLKAGGLQRPVPIDALVAGFRHFFASSRKHASDVVGTEIEAIDQVSDDRLRAYLERNPLAAWTNTGKNGERTVYFAYDELQGQFSFVGPKPSNAEAYAAAIEDRVAFRLSEYFEVRFERKNVFNVINGGDDRGIIMLGSDESAPIPRAQGWKPVMMNGRRWWAKFAKIAVNVLKEAPDDGASPNLLTQQLEVMFGPGGYLPQQGNRVRITPVPDEDDMWLIDAMGKPQSV
jgi:hypothetical protein